MLCAMCMFFFVEVLEDFQKNIYLCHRKTVDVAQLVRALDCGSRGRRFESGLPPRFKEVLRCFSKPLFHFIETSLSPIIHSNNCCLRQRLSFTTNLVTQNWARLCRGSSHSHSFFVNLMSNAGYVADK